MILFSECEHEKFGDVSTIVTRRGDSLLQRLDLLYHLSASCKPSELMNHAVQDGQVQPGRIW